MSKPSILLTREAFSKAVLARFDGRCCRPGCPHPADAAHHIVERRLWPDGGYYLANGAPLCPEDHMKAETTELSVEQMREWCGIKDAILPPQFDDGEVIDKWGNPILANGTRLRGEMFFDEQVQKALTKGGFLPIFTHHIKYPKSWHCPWSEAINADDRKQTSMDSFVGKRVIGTVKKDGENCSMYSDHIHARSLDSRHHPSRDWVKNFWNAIRYDIPEFWRVCGESLYAQHSIRYEDLESWFLGFSFWNDRNFCLPWDQTLEWFDLIGSSCEQRIVPVPVFFDGVYDEAAIRAAWEALVEQDRIKAAVDGTAPVVREGYVIRLADGFAYRDFRTSVAKFVRRNHVQTDKHWMHGPVIPNGLRQAK